MRGNFATSNAIRLTLVDTIHPLIVTDYQKQFIYKVRDK